MAYKKSSFFNTEMFLIDTYIIKNEFLRGHAGIEPSNKASFRLKGGKIFSIPRSFIYYLLLVHIMVHIIDHIMNSIMIDIFGYNNKNHYM